MSASLEMEGRVGLLPQPIHTSFSEGRHVLTGSYVILALFIGAFYAVVLTILFFSGGRSAQAHAETRQLRRVSQLVSRDIQEATGTCAVSSGMALLPTFDLSTDDSHRSSHNSSVTTTTLAVTLTTAAVFVLAALGIWFGMRTKRGKVNAPNMKRIAVVFSSGAVVVLVVQIAFTFGITRQSQSGDTQKMKVAIIDTLLANAKKKD